MSYRDLPPGRERMLAYARDVETRNREREPTTYEAVASVLQNIQNARRSSWRHAQDIVFGSIRASTNRLQRMNNLQISPFYEYEVLSDLPDVKVGLISKNLIDKSTIDSSKGMSFCTICQQDIYLDIVRKLNCTHQFHVDCIDRWFVENKKCPQCRFEI